MRPAPNCSSGFTLVELMVTIGIVAIVSGLAAPGLRSFIVNNRLTTAANDIVTAIAYSRNEAVRRGTTITLCKSGNGTGCTISGNWQQGWIVFADPNGNAAVDIGEEILRIQNAIPQGMQITGSADAANFLSFASTAFPRRTDGSAIANNTTLTVCTTGFTQRIVSITSTGRTSTSRGGACS